MLILASNKRSASIFRFVRASSIKPVVSCVFYSDPVWLHNNIRSLFSTGPSSRPLQQHPGGASRCLEVYYTVQKASGSEGTQHWSVGRDS